MAKMTLEHGKTRISINGDNDLIARERTAFYNFVRSLQSASPDERIQRQKSESEHKSVPTWAEMKRAADEGRLSELVKSGDRLPLVLKNGEKIDLDVGRDESGRTFFIFHHLMNESHYMNEDPTNFGGWRDCDMRRYANEDIYDLLPDEVKAVIVSTRIVQMFDGERVEIRDNLFCLSATQVFGRSEFWSELEPEDTPIDIFRDPRVRVKVQQDEVEVHASWWWLRSANANGNNCFNSVNRSGNYSYNYAYCSGAVALSFCIEESN